MMHGGRSRIAEAYIGGRVGGGQKKLVGGRAAVGQVEREFGREGSYRRLGGGGVSGAG